jgi:hypothetical protein
MQKTIMPYWILVMMLGISSPNLYGAEGNLPTQTKDESSSFRLLSADRVFIRGTALSPGLTFEVEIPSKGDVTAECKGSDQQYFRIFSESIYEGGKNKISPYYFSNLDSVLQTTFQCRLQFKKDTDYGAREDSINFPAISFTLFYDRVAPVTILYPPPGVYGSEELELKIECRDDHACDKTNVKINGIESADKTEGGIMKISLKKGRNVVEYMSTDLAGNSDGIQEVEYIVGNPKSTTWYDFGLKYGLPVGDFNGIFSRALGLNVDVHFLGYNEAGVNRLPYRGWTLSLGYDYFYGQYRNVSLLQHMGQAGFGPVFLVELWPKNIGYLTINPGIVFSVNSITGGGYRDGNFFVNTGIGLNTGYRYLIGGKWAIFSKLAYAIYYDSAHPLQSIRAEIGFSLISD